MQHPEDVLDRLAAEHPGLTVEFEPKHAHGHTLIHLDDASGHRILTVNEPPAGWPVEVTHYHAHPGVVTNYRYHHAHDPNILHPESVHEETKLTRAEWQEIGEREKHPPIDGPEALLALCEYLLGHEETERGRALQARHAQRQARSASRGEQSAAAAG